MMMNLLVGLMLQTQVAQGPYPVQMGFRLDPDTVTVGDHVTLVITIVAPRGSQVQFPDGPDTASAQGKIPVEIIGKRATALHGDTAIAGYRLSVWDIGTQTVNMPDALVSYRGRIQHVPLSGITLFAKSVLPADTSLRKPKPARPPITLFVFNWRPWLLALLGLIIAGLIAWYWWRRRRAAAVPLAPYERAKLEFERVSKQFPADREPDRHVAEMVNVMRDYLAARVTGIRRSYTTGELLATLATHDRTETGLPALLEKADLVKFARARATPDEALAAGNSARSIVDSTEARIVAAESAESQGKLEKAA